MNRKEAINFALERVKARIRINDLVTGLLILLAVVTAYLVVAIAVDQAAPMEHSTRLWLLGVLGVMIALGLSAILAWPSIRRVNDLYAARLVERQAEDQFRNSLVTAVQFRHDPSVLPDVLQAIESKAAGDLTVIDLDMVINRRPLRYAVTALTAVLALTVIFAIFSNKSFFTSGIRVLGSERPPATATRIVQVRPPDGKTVMAGQSVEVTADVGGNIPETVRMELTRDGKYWDAVPMLRRPHALEARGIDAGNLSKWALEVDNLAGDVKFRVVAGDAKSQIHTIHVQPLPAVASVETRLTYPAYTLLAPAVKQTGHVDALVGTQVEVVARTNQPPTDPKLVFSKQERRLPMTVTPRTNEARRKFLVQNNDNYTVQFTDKDRRYSNNATTVAYRVRVLQDREPQVELSPSGEKSVPANGSLQLKVTARDDFGIGLLEARWQRLDSDGDGQGPEQKVSLRTVAADRAVRLINDTFPLKVADLGLKADERAVLRVVATDRFPEGPHETRSEPLIITVTPPEEDAGGGSESQETAEGGGSGENSDGQSGTTGGAGGSGGNQKTETTAMGEQERSQLEKLRQALENQQKGEGGDADGQQQGTGGNEAESEKPQDGTDTANTDNQNNSEGQASSINQQPSDTSPKTEPNERLGQFDESGTAQDAALTDAQLLKSSGPVLKRLKDQLRAGKVDPALLKELGWTETQLNNFVVRMEDRFDNLADKAEHPREATTVTKKRDGQEEITASRGNGSSAATGSGTSTSNEKSASVEQSLTELYRRKLSPHFEQLVAEYLKAISEAESAEGQ